MYRGNHCVSMMHTIEWVAFFIDRFDTRTHTYTFIYIYIYIIHVSVYIKILYEYIYIYIYIYILAQNSLIYSWCTISIADVNWPVSSIEVLSPVQLIFSVLFTLQLIFPMLFSEQLIFPVFFFFFSEINFSKQGLIAT